MADRVGGINQRLLQILDAGAFKAEPLAEAMKYSVFAGGKRLRPLLLLAACESVSGAYDETALDFACAAELIHTYSLIHDDLPCMDDDDLRRGQPTCHIKYGEALALLAGDALLNKAYEVMAGACVNDPRNGNCARALSFIANAAGAEGMVSGQVLDILNESGAADTGALTRMYELKTGALIQACFAAGAVLGGGDSQTEKEMNALGATLGLAFQIKDDILDVTATTEKLGKPARSDEKNQKTTYVSLLGVEGARDEYRRLSDKTVEVVARIPFKTDTLQSLVFKIIHRDF
ncbi:MAG: polyprenyl synthetase family protein [Clostridiales bacterium]|jgi:geranylgeranyl diphosphate synthase type II|nr:polyprenyl synthetase family protein [Clostridiales bacterium]